ncbi:meiosis-specific nuclear structural protein 1-like isoform X2 [Leguminivora glycinivorella]|uniref:meiosis-specific nuclear structural protein 1-like isoform X2 n=1 Tax=Leguminivora glycinivorella TaxID=1035111 RepID=UPI00200F3D06|nr:meiosis-specific nuclear structural protein 1-like isoform X2 [Leguminivora glycinivorella]
MLKRTDHAAIVNARAKKEADLASEVAKVRHEEATELLRRHYLRERDPELRELTKKLQAGYVCRDLRQQILHNEYRRVQEKAEEDRANSTLLAALGDDQEAKKRALQKMQQTTAYCQELQQQLVNRQRQRQCQYEDALIEQKMLDDVMRTISDEDQRELKQKRDLMEKTQREMVTFKKARDAWRAKQRELAILEEEAIERQQQAAADRSASITAERERRERIKEAINAKICAQILADEAERQDRDNIIRELQENEVLEKQIQGDIAEGRKQEFVKASTMTDLTAQMDLKKREAELERQRQVDFRKESEAKLAALDSKEHEKQQIKKEKARQYSIDLKQQIADNAKRRESERRLEDARAKAVFDYYKDWKAEVSKEREKIVAEHVPPLLGYIQAGVLARADLPAVRAGAARRPRLAALDVDAMAAASNVHRHPKCNPQCRVLREY